MSVVSRSGGQILQLLNQQAGLEWYLQVQNARDDIPIPEENTRNNSLEEATGQDDGAQSCTWCLSQINKVPSLCQ